MLIIHAVPEVSDEHYQSALKPIMSFSDPLYLHGFACAFAAFDKGLVRAVGVCNYNIEQLKHFHSLVDARGIPVASNQVGPGLLPMLRIISFSGLAGIQSNP
jgi:diketogulonate reductase-like aldo/keto reductase